MYVTLIYSSNIERIKILLVKWQSISVNTVSNTQACTSTVHTCWYTLVFFNRLSHAEFNIEIQFTGIKTN